MRIAAALSLRQIRKGPLLTIGSYVVGAFADMGLECHRPLGAFYAFPSVARFGLPARDFALKLLHEHRVAVVPGTAFGACGEGFVRCAYATSMENIREAMSRLRQFISKPLKA